MKKIFLTLLALLAFSASVLAQNIEIKHYNKDTGEETLVGEEPVRVNKPTGIGITHDTYFHVYNTTSNAYRLHVTQVIVTHQPNGLTSDFCFVDACVPGTSPSYLLQGNASFTGTKALKGTYWLDAEVVGEYEVNYLVVNETADDTTVVRLIVNLEPSSDIQENAFKQVEMTAYPNPASSNVNINYELPQSNDTYELVIRNLLGQVQYRTVLSSNQTHTSLPVSSFNAGIYMYSIESKGRVLAVKKLIIN